MYRQRNYLPEFKNESFVIKSMRIDILLIQERVFEHLRESVRERDLKKLCWDLKQEAKSIREIEIELNLRAIKSVNLQ